MTKHEERMARVVRVVMSVPREFTLDEVIRAADALGPGVVLSREKYTMAVRDAVARGLIVATGKTSARRFSKRPGAFLMTATRAITPGEMVTLADAKP